MSGASDADGTEPVHVCIVAPSLDIIGGQAVQAKRLLDRLRESPSLAMGFLPHNPRAPGALRLLQRVKYVRTIVTSAIYIALLLRRVPRYDVIHVFSASYWSFLLAPFPALLVGRMYGKRVVLNYHSGEAEDHLTRWRRIALPIMRLAHAVVVPSAYLVEVFARFGLRSRAVVNFVECERIPYRHRRALRPVLLSNRNFAPHYNVAGVLRAFAIVQRQFPSARLIVAGDGAERDALRALSQALDLHDVEFVGSVAPDDMGRLYDAADLYINASNVDNMPLSILEAYAAGLPVVSTAAGGIPYLVEHETTGLLVAPGDVEALAAAVLRLLEDPELAARLSSSGRRQCTDRYGWGAVRREWEGLYRDLTRAPPAGAHA